MKKNTERFLMVLLAGCALHTGLYAADSDDGDDEIEEVVRRPQDLAIACWQGSEAVRICLCAGVDPNALYSDMQQTHGDIGFKRPLWGLATTKNIKSLDWEKAFNLMIRAGARLDLPVFVGTINSGRTGEVGVCAHSALRNHIKLRDEQFRGKRVEWTFLDMIKDRERRASGAEKETYANAAELVLNTEDQVSVWHKASEYFAIAFVLSTGEHQALS